MKLLTLVQKCFSQSCRPKPRSIVSSPAFGGRGLKAKVAYTAVALTLPPAIRLRQALSRERENESIRTLEHFWELRLAASLVVLAMLGLHTPDARAQAGKWIKLAPFPEPAEELYGIAAGG